MLRAPESGEVSAAVRGWLTGQGYGAVTDDAPPERLAGGADFWVYALRFVGPGLPQRWSAPLVARVPARAGRYDMLRQESAVQSWAAAQGYPAPEVLTVLAPGEALPSPVQLMARVPGVPLIAASGRPWGIPALMVQLGAAHAELHRLGSPPADAHPGDVPDNWLRLVSCPEPDIRSGAAAGGQTRKAAVSSAAQNQQICTESAMRAQRT